ncbi:MAG: metal-dependent transcriptional regulator [Candidatus Bathyarchaeota archaeon]
MSHKEKSVSSHAEEYLEAIYRLENKAGFARTMELARELGVVAGSITNTIDNLERKGLVIHEPYKGVKLSEDGRRIASNILRRHRLAERLLTDFLHIDWSEVHEPACKLEHAISPEIIKNLDKALGHPKRCPHGNPIPLNCGGIIEERTIALTEVDIKTNVVIVKIIEEKVDLLKKLTNLNLTPGKQIEIMNKSDANGELVIGIENKNLIIDSELASKIFVKKNEMEVKD